MTLQSYFLTEQQPVDTKECLKIQSYVDMHMILKHIAKTIAQNGKAVVKRIMHVMY